MSGTDTDPESTVATVQDPPDTEHGDAPAAAKVPAESQPPTEVPADHQDSATQRIGKLSPKARRRLPVALGVLVIASTIPVGLLGLQAIRTGDAEQNAAAAQDAARTSTSQVLSYDSKTLDADLARARTRLSGVFAAQFEEMASNVIVPASQKQDISSKVEVIRSALIEAQQDRAEVLLYLSQTASTSSQPQPQRETIQVTITMTKTADGQWLISELQPL